MKLRLHKRRKWPIAAAAMLIIMIAVFVWAWGPWPADTIRVSDRPIYDIDISPDGRLLAVVEFDGLTVWEIATGERLAKRRLTPYPVQEGFFSGRNSFRHEKPRCDN